MPESIGWIGSICLAICGLPQAIMSYKQGHSEGISSWLLYLWFAGEVFTIVYIFPKSDWPLLFNYSMNIVFLTIIFWYKYFPRKTQP